MCVGLELLLEKQECLLVLSDLFIVVLFVVVLVVRFLFLIQLHFFKVINLLSVILIHFS